MPAQRKGQSMELLTIIKDTQRKHSEMFYGVRPKDRDFVKERLNKIAEILKEYEMFKK